MFFFCFELPELRLLRLELLIRPTPAVFQFFLFVAHRSFCRWDFVAFGNGTGRCTNP